jgi:hypothetical protein
LSPKTKKITSILLKVSILVLATIFIFKKLNHNENLRNFNDLINNMPRLHIYLILGIILMLMFLNWFLESVKWRFLVKPIERITIWRAVESVFCGLTWAIFTPNRIGEYGGRVLFLSPRKRLLGAMAMAVGAISQMIITNVLGALAILWFIGRYIPLNFWLHYAIAFLVMIFCSFFLLFYFNIRWLNNLLLSIDFFKRFRQILGVLTRYRKTALLKVLLYSLLRFIVFTSQYCIIITMLIPGLHIFDMCMMIFILFFVQSALPSLDLLDVGVRSMTATYFFSYITHQDVAIIAATACIWLINLVLPAIIGTVFVFKLNFFGTNRD